MLFGQGNHQLMMEGLIKSLLFAMTHIPALHKLFFGNESRLLFTSATKSIVEKHRIIVQLSALAILHIGRGPPCLQPSVINYMFYSQVDNNTQLVDHGELMDNINQIESGDNSPLYECKDFSKIYTSKIL